MSRSKIGSKIAIAVLLIACNLPSLFTGTPPEEAADPQVAALRQLEADSERPPEVYFEDGFPRFVSGGFQMEGSDAVERAGNFLETYQDLYRIASPDLKLTVRRVSEDEDETNVVFYQTYKDLEVFASELVVTLIGDRVEATVGGLLNGDVRLEITPDILPQQAEEIVRADLGLPDAKVAGITALMIFDRSLLEDASPEAHLAWRVTTGEPAAWRVFVDAQTGQVLYKYTLMYDGAGLEDYDFEEFNAKGGDPWDCYYLSGDHIGSEDGLDRRWHSEPEAAHIWWFARDVYLFFHDTFGRHSYDDDDSQFEVFINGGVPNASWVPECELAVFNRGWVGEDIVAHEFTHGVIQSTSDLVYANQSGALNETYADVMASVMDGDWTIGEGRIGGGGAIRDMSNPPAVPFGDPDRSSNFVVTAADNGGVHTNSGITNKAAFLISAGGSFNGFTITGIGNGKMGELFYATMTRLGSSAQLIDGRNATVARADRWGAAGTNGFTPFDACQVQNAYAAVELGNGDTDCDTTDDVADTDDDEDRIPDSRDNCPLAANPGQQDNDGDGQGDACDTDDDNDTVPDTTDNCIFVSNSVQGDSDGDGIGNSCDDEDADGVLDAIDNCVGVANSDQRNTDRDEQGNACDTDDDNDRIPDVTDNCPLIGTPDQADRDGDGVGDHCDNSPDVANPGQEDADGDSIGDATDNCPAEFNNSQRDTDLDGHGDVCDQDDEFNTIPDGSFTRGSLGVGPGLTRDEPIPSCTPNSCPPWFPPDYFVSIVMTGLSPDVGVWVIDDTGKSIDRSPYKDDLRVLRFHPDAGRSYYLHFLFSPDAPAGQAEFMILMSAGPKDQQPNPTPAGPTSTPLPPPPAIGDVPLQIDTPGPAGSVILTFSKNAFCRKGPSVLYQDVSDFQQGDTTQADGRNDSDPRWWWVLIPNSTDHCWVSDTTVNPNDLAENLPIQPATLELPEIPADFFISNRACSPNGYLLQLSWVQSARADGYTLYLNGKEIAVFKPNQTSYQENPPMDKPLHYELEAFNDNGFSERLRVDDHCP